MTNNDEMYINVAEHYALKSANANIAEMQKTIKQLLAEKDLFYADLQKHDTAVEQKLRDCRRNTLEEVLELKSFYSYVINVSKVQKLLDKEIKK